MGMALDLHFTTKGNHTRSTVDMNVIRSDIFGKYMRASYNRAENQIFLESAGIGAKSWVHFDVTDYKQFQTFNFFSKTATGINGETLVSIAQKMNLAQLAVCGGAVGQATSNTQPQNNLDKNVKAFLDTIAKCEGTYGKGDNGYNVLVKGGLFTDYSDHPIDYTKKAIKVNDKGLYSSAAGRYQIMRFNWYGKEGEPATGLKTQKGFTDFKPETQDLAAIALLKRRGAYDYIQSGKIRTALKSTKIYNEWASLPGNDFKQHKYSVEQVLKFYIESGGQLNE